jgi:hypothetical protein
VEDTEMMIWDGWAVPDFPVGIGGYPHPPSLPPGSIAKFFKIKGLDSVHIPHL